MSLTARSFSIVKNGNPPEYNDDSVAADVAHGRFAISDGAAESGFAGLWSRALVDQFVKHAGVSCDDWQGWLRDAQTRWLDELRDVQIPYYGEQQFQQGAFATFLGLVLHVEAAVEDRAEERSWQAVAVGDSCLFHTRGNQLLKSFPLAASKEFGRFPKLVGSRSPVDEIALKRAVTTTGRCLAGDRLWLASDALAKWFLVEVEAEQRPWHELEELVTDSRAEARFASWVDDFRATRHLENDDISLLAVEL